MSTDNLNHPDLDQLQLHDFTRLFSSAIFHLFHAHGIIIEEIFEGFKDRISTESRKEISTVIRSLDDAITTSVKLRKSLFADIKYHNECAKRERREERQRKKQVAKEAKTAKEGRKQN